MTNPELLLAYEGLVRVFAEIGVDNPHASAIATMANHAGTVKLARQIVEAKMEQELIK